MGTKIQNRDRCAMCCWKLVAPLLGMNSRYLDGSVSSGHPVSPVFPVFPVGWERRAVLDRRVVLCWMGGDTVLMSLFLVSV